jgi:hypothetical protein
MMASHSLVCLAQLSTPRMGLTAAAFPMCPHRFHLGCELMGFPDTQLGWEEPQERRVGWRHTGGDFTVRRAQEVHSVQLGGQDWVLP